MQATLSYSRAAPRRPMLTALCVMLALAIALSRGMPPRPAGSDAGGPFPALTVMP